MNAMRAMAPPITDSLMVAGADVGPDRPVAVERCRPCASTYGERYVPRRTQVVPFHARDYNAHASPLPLLVRTALDFRQFRLVSRDWHLSCV